MTTLDRQDPAPRPSLQLAQEGRELLKSQDHGLLSTRSARYPEYPFGSLTPYALSAAGHPLILISSLAEHTRNLERDVHCSLMVYERSNQDPQAARRLTLLGEGRPLPATDRELATVQYLARHPWARMCLDMTDFALWELVPRHVRYIAGFGRMGWMEGTDLQPSTG